MFLKTIHSDTTTKTMLTKTCFIFNSPKHPRRGHKSHFSLCIRVPLRRQEKISWNLQHPPMNVKWLGWCRWKKPLKNAIYVGPPVALALKGRTSFPRENSMCVCVCGGRASGIICKNACRREESEKCPRNCARCEWVLRRVK